MDDGGRCLLDVINDPLLLQSFLEDKDEESAKELGSLSAAALENALLGQQDQVTSTTSILGLRQSPDSMGYACVGANDKSLATAVGELASSAAPSPQVVVSSTVPPPPAPSATAASNGLPPTSHPSPHSAPHPSPHPAPHPSPHTAPHSTRSPAGPPARPQSASPGAWSSSGPSPRSQSAPTAAAAIKTAQQAQQAQQLQQQQRPTVLQVVSAATTSSTATVVRSSGAPRLIQPKQPQLLPKLSGGGHHSAPAATTRSQSPRAAPHHKTPPQPTPAPPAPPPPQVAPTLPRGAAVGGPLLLPPGQATGMFASGAGGTFLLNQYIPGIGQSPILIQGSLGQIQGVQLALRPSHPGAGGLTLGSAQGGKPHAAAHHHHHQGHPTLMIPQSLGPRPNIILAPRMMSSPLSFAFAPGQTLTLQQLQQLQAMLPPQTMLAQPTLGHFQTDQQGLMQIPTFTQPQLITHDHHHHHHHHPTMAGQLLSAAGAVVSSAPTATIVTHHPPATTTTVLHPMPLQQPATVTVQHTPPPRRTPPQPQPQPQPQPVAAEKPAKAPPVNLAELLKEHGIMPESTPPPSPPSNQENQVMVMEAAPLVAPAPMAVTETVQVMASKPTPTVMVSPRQQVQLSLAHDGSVVLRQPTPPEPVPPPAEMTTTTTTQSVATTSAPVSTALSRAHSALLERLSVAPPVNVPDLASLTSSARQPVSVVAPPHHLTLHTVNNGLVSTQQLAQPHSFVTVHGGNVANMANVTLCHGANNGSGSTGGRLNHIVVNPSPAVQQTTTQHGCHVMTNSIGNPVANQIVNPIGHPIANSIGAKSVPTVTTSTSTLVVTTAKGGMQQVMVTTVSPMPAATTSASVAVAPTVTTHSTSNSMVVAHACPRHAPQVALNSQNQQLYEQLQTQITYLNSLKKPTMQQKVLLQQMLAVEEKLREAPCKAHVSSSSNDNTVNAVPAPQAPMPQPPSKSPAPLHPQQQVNAVINKAMPGAVLPGASVISAPTRTASRPSHHKSNHVDAKSKSVSSSAHTGTAASAAKQATSHSVGNQVVKLTAQQQHQLHHAVLHPHQHHPAATATIAGSAAAAVNQRSPPTPHHQPRSQTVVLRLQQQPTNHVIAPAPPTKQILVQVPSVTNKQVMNKNNSNASGSNSNSTKASPAVPPALLPSKQEPVIAAKPAPLPELPKPPVVKPKVPDRFQRVHMIHQRLSEDQNGAMAPDTTSPFGSRTDACRRLLRYHVYNTRLPREEDLDRTDELFSEVSERLLEEREKLYRKFHYLMLLEGMRDPSTAEKLMVDKLFLEHESDALASEKQAAEQGQCVDLPPALTDPWPSVRSPPPPTLQTSRSVKKEPPDAWLDDRGDLEPAAKRRSVKEEDDRAVTANDVSMLTPPRMSTTVTPPCENDVVSSIRKELYMSAEEEEDFAGLADFEPPVVRFTLPELKHHHHHSHHQHHHHHHHHHPPVVPAIAADWTCPPKVVEVVPSRAPELDLSGIEGLDDDDDSGGGGVLVRTHYFSDDEDDDLASDQPPDQVQSAINSILDFRGDGTDGVVGVDSTNGARGGAEPMDYDEGTGTEAPPDSVLDEAVRSILL